MSTVMLVEDNLSQREMIASVLRENGIEVISVQDGLEALNQVERIRPDLVVLDIIMPRLNGYEVCRRLKSNPVTQQVPVVMCSSKGEEFDRYWGMKQGADAYITKPFIAQELVQTVRNLLKR
jgi:twitching motility two-component system response regulator PilH